MYVGLKLKEGEMSRASGDLSIDVPTERSSDFLHAKLALTEVLARPGGTTKLGMRDSSSLAVLMVHVFSRPKLSNCTRVPWWLIRGRRRLRRTLPVRVPL